MSDSASSPTSIATRADVAIGPITLRSRSLAFWLLLLLALQFLLGMVANLYVPIPATHPGTDATNFFGGVVQGLGWALAESDWSLQLHVLTGLALIVVGIGLSAIAYITHARVWMTCAPLSVLGIVVAGFNGASFINYGETMSSLLMSVGFLVALVPLVVGLFLTPRPNQ